MKNFMVLLSAMVLMACSMSNPFTNSEEPNEGAATAQTENIKKIAELGEVCGGTEKTLCAGGLLCEFTENTSNASGVCVDTVTDKGVECSDTQAPLCGIRKGQKNAYQNDCQLARHGAEMVSSGFCSPDPTVIGSCEATAAGIGTCFETFQGYVFTAGECVKRFVSGCAAEIPFDTLSACETSCK